MALYSHAEMPMLSQSQMSARERLALVLLVIFPLTAMAALTVRVVDNEAVAIRQSMEAELAASSGALAARYEKELASLSEQLDRATSKEVPVTTPSFAARVALKPQVSDDGSTPPVTRPQSRRSIGKDAKECRSMRDRLKTLVTDRDGLVRFYEHCTGARARSGRFAWPLVAFHPAAVVRPSLAQLLDWMRTVAPESNERERAAVRLEIREASWLAASVRVELVALAVSDVVDRDAEEVAHRHLGNSENPRIVWSDRQSRGELRRDSQGGYTGFVIDRLTLEHALVAGWPDHPASMNVVLVATSSEERAKFDVLDGSLSLALTWRNPHELSQRTTRSRRLLAGGATFAGLTLVGLAWVLWSRLRAQRQLSSLRTDFVAAVSHELRTPIASIRMLSELLADDQVDEGERPQAQRALANEARRLGETVDQLLNFSRLEAGKSRLERAERDVSQLVTRTIDTFEERHGLTVVRSVQADLWANVDAAGIAMAVRNLLENARKHAPDGEPYAVALERYDGDVVVSVTDSGPGVAESDQERIFRSYERVDDRLSHATEGSGIGLSLVKHVVEGHGGSVSVKSELGRGARFELRFPAIASTGPAVAAGGTAPS